MLQNRCFEVLFWIGQCRKKILQSFLICSSSFAGRYTTALLSKNQKKENAQIGIRIRVAAVTGLHDRPLHYLGKFCLCVIGKWSRLPDSNRGHRGSRAVCPQALILLQPRTLPSELSRVMTALITMMFKNINLSEFIRTSQTLIWLDGKYVGKSSIYARINRICRNRLFKMPQNHVRGPVSCHQNLPVRTQT